MRKQHLLVGGVLLLATVLFFAIRLPNLLALPMFTDEAIYIRWAQIAAGDAAWRFISLTDGKQPSYVWFAIITLKLFDDPLLAGRMVSILAGFATMVGMFFLGKEIFKNLRIGVICAFLYVVYPMAVVYDRMALYDSLVAMFMVWAFYLTVLMARTLRLDVALILGMVIGGGVLTKTNVFFSMYLLPFATLLLPFSKKTWKKHLATYTGLAAVACFLGFGIYNILRLSPFFHIIEEKNALFVYPFSEWLQHPFRFVVGNLTGQFDWLVTYLTLPVFLLALLAPFVSPKFAREKLVLFIWFFAPFLALAVFGKTLYPRFIFFMTLFLLPLVGFTVDWIVQTIKQRIIASILIILLFFFQLWSVFGVITEFGTANIPKADKNQYSNDWPSGYGLSESTTFFQEEAKRGKIFVATQGTFGLLPYGYEIYLGTNEQVTIKGYWPIEDDIPEEVQTAAQRIPTYFVFYQPCVTCVNTYEAPQTWPVEKIQTYPNPYGNSYMTIYKVTGN